jgi:SAM-dependent methyltransferase
VRYPLDLMKCSVCEHVQLRHVVGDLFTADYKYSTPDAFRPHLEALAQQLKKRYSRASRVLEIGSNNGLFLRVLQQAGFQVAGCDPVATDAWSIAQPFTSRLARSMLGKFDIAVALNVFAHIDDLQDVFQGLDSVLAEDGAIVFEVQYLPDLIQRGAFDMIYHEHVDYHTLGPLKGFLRRMGFVMTGWEKTDAHGGSIRVTARRRGAEATLPRESLDWQQLEERVEAARRRLDQAVADHAPLVAFGATAKACTLVHQFGIARHIAYCVDDTPQKQGRYIAGTDIQVCPVARLKDETVLLTAWNYEEQIRKRIPNRLVNPFI